MQQPVAGVKSRAEANQLFAAEKLAGRGSGKWGRPCRCMQHPRPHEHYQCPVDVAVKLPVVEGALTIVQRATGQEEGDRAMWANGTAYRLV